MDNLCFILAANLEHNFQLVNHLHHGDVGVSAAPPDQDHHHCLGHQHQLDLHHPHQTRGETEELQQSAGLS